MEKHPHPTGMRAGKGPQSRAKHAHQRLRRLVNITKLVFFGLLLISAVPVSYTHLGGIQRADTPKRPG